MLRLVTAREQLELCSPWQRLGFNFQEDEYAQHAAQVERKLAELNQQGIDSRSIHGRVAGNGRVHWTPERRRQHQDIIRSLHQQMQQVPAEGKGMMLGGLGGAGKGSIQRGQEPPLDTRGYFTLDPDQVKEEMAKRGMIPPVEGLSPMEASPLVHEEASMLTKRLAGLAYRQKRNLLWDITMSGDKSVAQRLEGMRKAGYGQVDAAFVDSDTDRARQRALRRHRKGEESYRNGQGFGGRWVPEGVSHANAPTPGSGKLSRNAEVFDRLRPQFDNTVTFDVRGQRPQISSVTGTRWPGPSQAAPAPPSYAGDQEQRIAGRGSMPTVREILGQYEGGRISYPELVATLGRHEYAPHEHGGDWAQIYARAEEMPDDNSFFWIEAAVDHDLLTVEQVDQIIAAIDHYHR